MNEPKININVMPGAQMNGYVKEQNNRFGNFQETERSDEVKVAPIDPVATSMEQFRLAPNMVGHVAKIIAAMYDNNMFVKSDGTPATNVETLARSLGAAFGEDFKNWRQTLSAAIDQQNCLDIFDELQSKIRVRKQKKR